MTGVVGPAIIDSNMNWKTLGKTLPAEGDSLVQASRY